MLVGNGFPNRGAANRGRRYPPVEVCRIQAELEGLRVSLRITLAATIVAFATVSQTFAAIAAASPGGPEGPDYTASSGDCVSRPVSSPTQPPGATALCADGTWSFSEHPYSGGTCHGHGGVLRHLA